MGPFGESLKEFALVIIDVLELYPTRKKESLGTLVYDLHPLNEVRFLLVQGELYSPKGAMIAYPVGVQLIP